MASCFGTTATPMFLSIMRSGTRPRKPPNAPEPTEPRAATLLLYAQRQGSFSKLRRDIQFRELFNNGESELLYSGDAMNNPSWSTKRCFSRFAFSGRPESLSRSRLQRGISKSLRPIRVTSMSASRAMLAAKAARFLVADAVRARSRT